MKTSIKTFAAAIALSALIAGPAAAMISPAQVTQDVYSAVGAGSNIFVSVRGGTVTLTGKFVDAGDQVRVLSKIRNSEGVTRIVNNAYVAS